MRITTRNATTERRSGLVLIAVLGVVAVLSLTAYRFSDLMLAEYQASESYARATQAREAANSGVAYAAAVMRSFDPTQSGSPYDNPSLFQGITLGDASNGRGVKFSIVAPPDPDTAANGALQQAFRYGVVDEAGKINVNALLKLDSSGQIAHDILIKIPGMDEDKVNALIDWIDADQEPRTNGAEDEYYSTLTPPYKAKNGPLDSLEEMLYIKGFTPQIVFGNDTKRNGQVDPSKDDGTGTLDQGLSAYLTVFSREQNIDSTGQPRIYINDSDLTTLLDKLSAAVGEDLANFIIAYRTYGPAQTTTAAPAAAPPSTPKTNPDPTPSPAPPKTPSPTPPKTPSPTPPKTPLPSPTPPKTPTPSPTPSPSPASGGGGTVNATSKLNKSNLNLPNNGANGAGGGTTSRPQSISSLYSLINAKVSIPSSTPGGQATIYPSPMTDTGSLKELLPKLLDKTTTQKGTELPARVNVNTASRAVLAALPNLDDASVDAIVNARPPLTSTDVPDPIFQTPAWLITEANLPAATMQALERYVTASPQVYRVQVVGHFEGGGPTARVEAVIDTNAGRPRIVYFRDLTELGRGYNLTSP